MHLHLDKVYFPTYSPKLKVISLSPFNVFGEVYDSNMKCYLSKGRVELLIPFNPHKT